MVVKFYNCTNTVRMNTDMKRSAKDTPKIPLHAEQKTEDRRDCLSALSGQQGRLWLSQTLFL